MRHCASQLKSSLTVAAQSCLDELISEANYRQDDMAEEWSMPARTEVLELWLHSPPDSEFVAAVSQKIILDSIVGASHWSYFVKKQKNLAGVLPPPLRAVFRLALLLARVPYPSWKDFHHIKGWLSSNPEHLIGRIGPRVQLQRAAIAKHTDALDDLPDFIAGRADPYTLACNLHDEIQSRFDTLAKRTTDHINRIAETIAEGRLLPKNEGYSAGTRDGAASSDTDSIADSKPFADMESGKAKGLQPYVYKRVATG